jgi:hypothetical protein
VTYRESLAGAGRFVPSATTALTVIVRRIAGLGRRALGRESARGVVGIVELFQPPRQTYVTGNDVSGPVEFDPEVLVQLRELFPGPE